MDYSQKIAHILTKTGTLYNAYNANNLLFTTSLATLGILYCTNQIQIW